MCSGFSQVQVILDPQRGEARRQLPNQAAIVLEELAPRKVEGKRLKHETKFDGRHNLESLSTSRPEPLKKKWANDRNGSKRTIGKRYPSNRFAHGRCVVFHE